MTSLRGEILKTLAAHIEGRGAGFSSTYLVARKYGDFGGGA